MRNYAGLWIDHEGAVIVKLEGENELVVKVKSAIAQDQHGHFKGGARTPSSNTSYSTGPANLSSESKYEKNYEGKLHVYYQDVISIIKDVDQLYIFGPSEAKKELENEISHSKTLASKVKKIETADKMTDEQIKARVIQFFK
mgnify:FL=1